MAVVVAEASARDAGVKASDVVVVVPLGILPITTEVDSPPPPELAGGEEEKQLASVEGGDVETLL